MRYFSLEEILEIHKDVIDEIGGSHGVLSQDRLEASVTQPLMTFG